MIFNISTIWIFLLGIRPFVEFLNIPSIVFTVLITGFQIIHFMLLLTKEKNLYVYYFLLIFLMILTVYNSATLAVVNILLSVILLRNEDLKKISLICFISILSALFIYISLLSLSILKNEIVIMPKGVAYTFGFSNSNGIGSFVMQITLISYIFIVSNFKHSFFLYLLLIPNYMVYRHSLGRTAFYTVLIFFAIMFIFSFFRKKIWKMRKIIAILPLLLFVCTIIACKVYQQYPVLDIVFTTRFSKNSVHLNSMTPFNYLIGYRLPPGPMDSAYLAQLFAGGLISVYIFISISIKGIAGCNFDFFYKYMPFIISLLASGFAENTFSSFSLQTVLFYKILCDQFSIKKIKRGYLYDI